MIYVDRYTLHLYLESPIFIYHHVSILVPLFFLKFHDFSKFLPTPGWLLCIIERGFTHQKTCIYIHIYIYTHVYYIHRSYIMYDGERYSPAQYRPHERIIRFNLGFQVPGSSGSALQAWTWDTKNVISFSNMFWEYSIRIKHANFNKFFFGICIKHAISFLSFFGNEYISNKQTICL